MKRWQVGMIAAAGLLAMGVSGCAKEAGSSADSVGANAKAGAMSPEQRQRMQEIGQMHQRGGMARARAMQNTKP